LFAETFDPIPEKKCVESKLHARILIGDESHVRVLLRASFVTVNTFDKSSLF
jgi:hypothetical protein